MMWSPARCNCYIWAFVMRWKYGGKMIVGKSKYGWWPHVAWIDRRNGDVWEYIPLAAKVKLKGLSQILPLRIVLFNGRVRRAGRLCQRNRHCREQCNVWTPERRSAVMEAA